MCPSAPTVPTPMAKQQMLLSILMLVSQWRRRMDFWRNLERLLHDLHQMPDDDNLEGWLALVHRLEAKRITPTENPAPPAISQQIVDACLYMYI